MSRPIVRGAAAVNARHTILAVSLAVAAGTLTACWDWGLAPRKSCSADCGAYSFVQPSYVHFLRGDTVRFIACDSNHACGVTSNDTGVVLATWSVPDSSVVVLSHGAPALVVQSATSVLVRGVAPGHTTIFTKFPNATTPNVVFVADSSAITSITLVAFPPSDTLRVGSFTPFVVRLADVFGSDFRARPTGWSVSDSTVIRVTPQEAAWDHALELKVSGLKAGKASLRVSFLQVSATVQLTVVP